MACGKVDRVFIFEGQKMHRPRRDASIFNYVRPLVSEAGQPSLWSSDRKGWNVLCQAVF